MKRVLVIGGGFAGLSAGVALSQAGCRVTLIDQSGILGGRAYSVEDGRTGEWIDNGQHALLGAFRETQRFLKKLGSDHLVRYQDRFRMVMAEEGGRRVILNTPPIPGPFHLAAGVVGCSGFSVRDRAHLLRAGIRIGLARSLPADLTLAQWMDRLGQPDSLRFRWWYPLAISALNEEPQRASAHLFLRVLKSTFFGPARNSAFGLISVGLGDLYTEQARTFIESRGGEVYTHAGAAQIVFSNQRVEAVVLRNGGAMTADYFVSAVPHHALKRLLPAAWLQAGGSFEGLSHLETSPMVSIHLWFDRPVMEEEFIGLVHSPIQWVFDKSRIWKKEGSPARGLACISSGARDLIDLPREELIALAVKEMARFFPEAGRARLLHSRLIKERQATYSCTPEAEKWRPAQQTPFDNLFLAGDWTRTGLPATIEGAVISGHRCAELILGSRSTN